MKREREKHFVCPNTSAYEIENHGKSTLLKIEDKMKQELSKKERQFAVVRIPLFR